jgi:hypothetical protein
MRPPRPRSSSSHTGDDGMSDASSGPAGQRLRAVAWTAGDRALAALAHAAIGFGLVGIGFLLSLAISGIIWLVSRHRPHVAVHAEQAGAYQLVVLAVNAVVIAGWLAASVALFGQLALAPPAEWTGRGPAAWQLALWLLAVPVFGLWYAGTIALGLIGALRVFLGYPFWYPVSGAWARRKHRRPGY